MLGIPRKTSEFPSICDGFQVLPFLGIPSLFHHFLTLLRRILRRIFGCGGYAAILFSLAVRRFADSELEVVVGDLKVMVRGDFGGIADPLADDMQGELIHQLRFS